MQFHAIVSEQSRPRVTTDAGELSIEDRGVTTFGFEARFQSG
jgi:hypothetical protein